MGVAKTDQVYQRRLTWALKDRSDVLKTALACDTSEQAIRLRESAGVDLVHALGQMIMEQADPSANKRFTPWLMREYAAGRLILEDLGSANDTLTLFQRYARRLKPEDRDIQRYKNLSAAWQAVREFAERDEAQSNRAQKALERAQAYAESRILQQDPDGFTVAVPLTEFAAKWWGRGTRWCTAAEKDNQFWHYHRQAPLFVMLIPGHGKFQMWVSGRRLELMDAADQPVSADLSHAIWPWVGRLLLVALEENGKVLQFIPEEQRTYERCLAAVRCQGNALQWVPQEHRTHDLCLAAVRQYGEALCWLLEEHRTYDIRLAAVQQNGVTVQWAPQEHLDYALCLAAVQQDGRALEWVPEEHRTHDLCLAAVQQSTRALEFVPEDHQTYDLCLAAVQRGGWLLPSIPQEHRTYDLCLAAVQQFGQALEFVPEEYRTYDLCLAAVRQNGWALDFVPQQQRTYDLCLAAVQGTGKALQYVPQKHRTQGLCLASVQQDGWLLRWVPAEQRTYDVCLAAVQRDGDVLRWVPQEHLSRDLCLAAVQQNGKAFVWVPKEHRTQDIYLASLGKARSAINLVPAPLHAELLEKLSTASIPAQSWDLDILTSWAEKMKTAPQPSLVQHA